MITWEQYEVDGEKVDCWFVLGRGIGFDAWVKKCSEVTDKVGQWQVWVGESEQWFPTLWQAKKWAEEELQPYEIVWTMYPPESPSRAEKQYIATLNHEEVARLIEFAGNDCLFSMESRPDEVYKADSLEEAKRAVRYTVQPDPQLGKLSWKIR